MRIIEGTFRVIEPEPPLSAHPLHRLARRIPRPIRYVLTRPIFWIWAGMISFVGLTEGLW